MTVQELVDWQRFALHYPFPAEVLDIHGAMTVCIIANVYREANSPVHEPTEFMVLRNRPEPVAEVQPITEAERFHAITLMKR